MASNASEYKDFTSVKERLDQIVAAVSVDNLPLDEALDLYEEAVALGMRASDLLEEGLNLDAETSPESESDAVIAAELVEIVDAEPVEAADDGQAAEPSGQEPIESGR